MAAVTMDLVLSNSTDATFRGWGKAISDRLAAFGSVKTADTGQIDWTTVLTPNTSSQMRGYEVWRMADALQAQAPVFMKIEYGSGGLTVAPGLAVTLATGSNGAGTLAGQVGARVALVTSTDMTTAPWRCVFSGDPGRLGFCLAVNKDDPSNCTWLVVERTKDASGADTAEGVFRCGMATISPHQQLLPFTGIIPPQEMSIGCMGPGAGTGALGSEVVLYPINPFNIEMKNPIRGAAGYFKADIPQDYTVQGNLYGLTQTFYTIGHAVCGPFTRPTGGYSGSGATWNGLALRYE
jgi:hypothetical protein